MLSINHLNVEFTVGYSSKDQQSLKAVNDVSLEIKQGETIAVVGESGSGKSQLFNAVMGLLPKNASVSGDVKFLDQSLLNQNQKQLNQIRGKEIGMIFQDPMTALNPYLRIGKQLTEVLEVHQPELSRAECKARAIEMLESVHIPKAQQRFESYPHELSGGMRQRVMIAMALLCKPKLIIADEPTTALDVTTQTEIIRLLKQIHDTQKTSIVLITHDLPIVAGLCDRIMVMYAGRIVESATVDDIFKHPKHPYTQALLNATPHNTKQVMNNKNDTPPLFECFSLNVIFNEGIKSGKNKQHQALKDVSFSLSENEILGVVGESGSGKSTLARTILQLQKPTSGKLKFAGADYASLNKQQQQRMRKDIQLIFQDPLDALNPRMTISQIIAEPLQNLMPVLTKKLTKQEISEKVSEMMEAIGLQAAQLNRYPHEFSGGQCQRIGIARAMIVDPKLLICDEPVSALDVSIQAQIINLLMDLKEQTKMSMIFISHDLSIVRQVCDRILVLYKGEIVEMGKAEDIYSNPQHEYTKKLLNSIPLTDPEKERMRIMNP
ncbi:UNVERIFIED_CONTAM: hypothetical protein GTU68_038135 [Idotea baltica]|nr:hypothetical protein [Idotea baltica]